MIVPQFQKFAAEGILIGRLLAGYGSLESALSACVAHSRDDFDMTIKAMFRARGETQPIDIADAIGRPVFRAGLGIGPMFSEAIADMRYCLKIRNQYAHCHWHEASGRLCFVDMEEIAKEHKFIADFSGLTFHYLNTALLTEQEEYFVYVGDCLLFLNAAAIRFLAPSTQLPTTPQKAQRPPLYLP